MNKKKKMWTALIITIFVGAGVVVYFIEKEQPIIMEERYRWLMEKCDILSSFDDSIADNYNSLITDYNGSEIDYDGLYSIYMKLLNTYYNLLHYYAGITKIINQMILPAQYMVFAEAVRRYYFEDFYIKDTWATGNISGFWYQYARFCRDIVLHSSQNYSSMPSDSYWFPEVSNALADYLICGNQTDFLAWDIFYNIYYDWLPYWCATSSGNALNDIDIVVQWCIDEIDYELDADIDLGQRLSHRDYVRFPIETAFRTMGDCEDQAMLCAAYLESRGYETALGVFHDAENNDFFHVTLLVHIEDTVAYYDSYSALLWSFGSYDPYEGYTWCWLDTTWDTPFGTDPSWMQYYLDNGLTFDDVTFAICDLDGAISL